MDPIFSEALSPAFELGEKFLTGYHGGAVITGRFMVIRRAEGNDPGCAVRVLDEVTLRERSDDGRLFVNRIGWKCADGVFRDDSALPLPLAL